MEQNTLQTDRRIKFLLYKIKNDTATKEERNEYLDLLFQGGYINKLEFDKYKKELNGEKSAIGEALVGIGLAVLVGTLIAKLFEKE
ncbi:hypothetical protein ABN763_04345 [Spongiivirga sp. MCCC 1A20706]|uniref:hypothetical protein n=1 Tax=Spongiivirga sp. MCCC 1A20706 TaxID=3160963 RepID=UPI00397768E1